MFEKELIENKSAAEIITDDSSESETAPVKLPKKTVSSKRLPLPFEPEDAETELITVPIEKIEEHDELSIRLSDYDRNEVSNIEQKIRNRWNDLPSIVVVLIGAIYYIVDGVYRWLASRNAGITEVKVRVIKGSLYDAFLFRARINCNQGIPLSLPEKKAIVTKILGTDEGWKYTDSLITFITGVSDKTIANIRQTDFSDKDIPVIRKAFKNGKLIEINTSKIGKRKSKKQSSTKQPSTEQSSAAVPANQLASPNDANSNGEKEMSERQSPLDSLPVENTDYPEDKPATTKEEDEYEYDPNLAAEAQKRKQVKKGDVYVIESVKTPGKPHVIACIDATLIELVLKLFQLFKAGLVIIDFPYNRDLKTKIGIGKVAHELHRIANDNLSSSSYRRLIRLILQNSRQVTEDGSGFLTFYGLHETIPTYYFVNRILGIIRKQIIWNKKGLRQNWSPDFRDGHEGAFFGSIGKKLRYWSAPKKNRTTMFNEVNYANSPWKLAPLTHPCPKPVPILADFINLTLEPGGVVFDPMMGSGSTVVAAETTGRRGVGTELIEAFVAVALERFEAKKHRWIKTTLDDLPNVLLDIEQNGWPKTKKVGRKKGVTDCFGQLPPSKKRR